jgi:hypothetical protein
MNWPADRGDRDAEGYTYIPSPGVSLNEDTTVSNSAAGTHSAMKNMPSPAKAERNQRRKLQFFPPVWPLIAVVAIVVIVAIIVSHR